MSTINRMTALNSMDLRGCSSLERLPDTIGQLTAQVKAPNLGY
jgi:hypothetical protein